MIDTIVNKYTMNVYDEMKYIFTSSSKNKHGLTISSINILCTLQIRVTRLSTALESLLLSPNVCTPQEG